MEKDFDQVIKERLAVLPQEIKDSISTLDWGTAVLPIGKKYGLTMEQLGDLQQESVFILVGLRHPNEYYRALKRLGLSDSTTANLVADMNERVFKNIRQTLIDFYEQEARDTAEGDPLQSAGVEIVPGTTPTEQKTPIATPTSSYEKTVLQNSGVELAPEITVDTPPAPPEKRMEMLEDIEHPPKTSVTPLSKFVELNRSTGVSLPTQKTNYAETPPATKETSPTPTPVGDPYREPI